jgi:hypothetical protein
MASVPFLFLRRTELLSLKLKAKRKGVWFKALSRLDRVLVELTIKVADKVQSSRLTEALLKVMKKMETALQNKISQAICHFGFSLVRKIGLLAKKWGNPLAESWMSDLSFARFLAVMHINSNQNMPCNMP